ncbi:MAG: hypothetical protein ACTHN4_11155 [Sphingomicrobium sp.]
MTAQDKLRAASPEVRDLALALMDELSAPMHPRQIEQALYPAGFTRSERRRIVMALKHLPIVAIGAGEP